MMVLVFTLDTNDVVAEAVLKSSLDDASKGLWKEQGLRVRVLVLRERVMANIRMSQGAEGPRQLKGSRLDDRKASFSCLAEDCNMIVHMILQGSLKRALEGAPLNVRSCASRKDTIAFFTCGGECLGFGWCGGNGNSGLYSSFLDLEQIKGTEITNATSEHTGCLRQDSEPCSKSAAKFSRLW